MKKKKIVLVLLVALMTVCFASCDQKLCYCYEGGYEQEVYTNSDTPCHTLGKGERGCVERSERMPADETAK